MMIIIIAVKIIYTYIIYIYYISNAFDTKFGPQWKDRKSSYHVKQILSLLCKLVTLILD